MSYAMISLSNFPIMHEFKSKQTNEDERLEIKQNVVPNYHQGIELKVQNNEGSTNTNGNSSQSLHFKFNDKKKIDQEKALEQLIKIQKKKPLQRPTSDSSLSILHQDKDEQPLNLPSQDQEEKVSESQKIVAEQQYQLEEKELKRKVRNYKPELLQNSGLVEKQFSNSKPIEMGRDEQQLPNLQETRKQQIHLQQKPMHKSVILRNKQANGSVLNKSHDFSYNNNEEMSSNKSNFYDEISSNKSQDFALQRRFQSEDIKVKQEKQREEGQKVQMREMKWFVDKGVQTVQLRDAEVQTNRNDLRVNGKQGLSVVKQRLKELESRKVEGKSQSPKKYYDAGYNIGEYLRQLRKEKRKRPLVYYLSENEMKVWILKMNRLKMNPMKYENIWNAFTIKRIRNHLYPPVWMPPSNNIQF